MNRPEHIASDPEPDLFAQRFQDLVEARGLRARMRPDGETLDIRPGDGSPWSIEVRRDQTYYLMQDGVGCISNGSLPLNGDLAETVRLISLLLGG